MIDAVAAGAPESTREAAWWPSRRAVAWMAILLNFALWAAIVTGIMRLIG